MGGRPSWILQHNLRCPRLAPLVDAVQPPLLPDLDLLWVATDRATTQVAQHHVLGIICLRGRTIFSSELKTKVHNATVSKIEFDLA